MKYADDIVNIMNDRGSINVPEDCTTSEEFDKWMHRANQGGRRMTREEAIAKIKHSIVSTRDCEGDYVRKFNEALEMAIKALEQQPCEDCISRVQAIEEADKLCLETGYDNEKVEGMLKDLPSVTPQPRKGA